MTETTKWRPVSERPKHNQWCHIRGQRNMVIVRILYKESDSGKGCWIDMFAEPEAGHGYDEDNGIVAWMPSEEINLDLPEEMLSD